MVNQKNVKQVLKSTAPSAVPSLATFLVCGHQCPPTARPNVANDGVEFSQSASLFSQPAMCLDCSVTHAKNRQQTIIDTYQSKLEAKYEDLIDRAVKVSNERDRTEILEKGKQAALEDMLPDRNVEVAQLWQDFAKTWSSAERVVTTPVPVSGTPNNKIPTKNYVPSSVRKQTAPPPTTHARIPSTQTLSVRIDKTNGHIAVIFTWRDRSGASVEKVEIMSL